MAAKSTDPFTSAIETAILSAQAAGTDVGTLVVEALRAVPQAARMRNLQRPEHDPSWAELATFVNEEITKFHQLPKASDMDLANWVRIRLVARGVFDSPP